jgi:hypothetical protein
MSDGLTAIEAARRLAVDGPNQLPPPPSPDAWPAGMSDASLGGEPLAGPPSRRDTGPLDGVTAWMIGEIGADDESRARHDALRADERDVLELWRNAFIAPGGHDLEAIVRSAHAIRRALRPRQVGGDEITEARPGGGPPTAP